MNLLSRVKFFNAIPPAAIKDNAAFASYVIDRQTDVPKDAKGIAFVCQLGATDVAMDTLKVMQSTAESNSTTLGGTPAEVHDFTTKPAADGDNELFVVYVTMAQWTQRYLQLQATAGDGTNGTFLSCLAIIDEPGEAGPTAALLGVDNLEVA